MEVIYPLEKTLTETTRQQIEAALFADDDGNVIGLEEVQFLEEPTASRMAILHVALISTDLELRYRAALVLTAWGDDRGLDDLEQLIKLRIDRQGIEIPHRIHGYNNLYDEFAYAVFLWNDSQKRTADRRRIYSRLLALYGECDFESKFKHALLNSDFSELLPEVIQAMQRATARDKIYLASQLLPVIARWDTEAAWDLFDEFLKQPAQTPHPAINVAEALGYFDSDAGLQLLKKLIVHPDSVVANQAKCVLDDQEMEP
ncbi:hypothetical protein Enr10x_00250 [Gimesia panareensis]|uniref:HEAT repeat protein n=1 Tax=Gimesia panareensis TaxID=2527978 RepID=A0A517PZC3_9PLAN|nr:hypothetical protein Enr10x_00250 [Gimesia panareensis]